MEEQKEKAESCMKAEIQPENLLDELRENAMPLVCFLRKSHNPYSTIIITQDSIKLVQDVIGIPCPDNHKGN